MPTTTPPAAASKHNPSTLLDRRPEARTFSVQDLLAADPDADAFALFFDLDAGDFVIPPVTGKRRADPSRWLPMTVVLDSEKLMRWLLEHAADADSRPRRDTAIQLGRRLREYEIPVRIFPESEDRSVDGMLAMVGPRPSLLPDVADRFNFRFAASKLLTLALLNLEPRNLLKARTKDQRLERSFFREGCS